MSPADPKRNIEGIYRLTPTQEGLLFHALYAPERGLYFEQFTCRLLGELQTDAFEAAWALVTERHDAVRALFTWERREHPLQVIRARVDVPFTVHDWSESRADDADRLESFLETDRAKGFQLDQAPLMRVALVRLGPKEHRLVWSFHHLILDGWSQRIFLDEVIRAYEALRKGDVPAPKSPTLRFGDYVDEWLRSQDHDAAATFWRLRLEGFDGPTDLRMPRPGKNDPGGHAEHHFALSPDATRALETMARQERVTLNVAVRAVWAILLSRYSDSTDVVFGATVSGRAPELPLVETGVGLYINTLPVRAKLDRSAPVRALLRTLQDEQVAGSAFEFSSLADVTKAVGARDARPLFQTIVVFENHPASTERPPGGLEVREPRYVERSNFPLALLVVPGERLELILVYDRNHHTEASVERLSEHFTVIAEAIANDPSASLGDVPMLPPPEARRLMEELSGVIASEASDHTVLQSFDRLAVEDPERVAAIAQDERISYGSLRRRARSVAAYLRAAGVEPDSVVAVGTSRSIEMLVGILGAFYASCAYVPLDPEWPEGRKAFVLEDTGARALLTTTALADRFESSPPKVLVDTVEQVELGDDDAPPQPVRVDQLAYVLYTSGSTGAPKGVAVTHRNLFHSTNARFELYPEPPDRFLLLSAFTFDSSVAGLFWTLSGGGALVLPPKRVEQDVSVLADWIARERVTHTLCLPSLYQLILEHAEPTKLETLRTVIVAGESCPKSIARLHADCLPEAALYNEYGPTEATVWSTVHRIATDDPGTSVPIGRPVPGSHVYLLDARRRPTPIGIPGEMYLGGPGLARGYLNDPERTAERFVQVALDGENEQRLYRTGDLARFREDGLLEFLGRRDEQVKIRGYRIELEEIENALRRHPIVGKAAVAIRVVGDASSISEDPLLLRLEALSASGARRLLDDVENPLDDEDSDSEMLGGAL